MKKRKLNSKNPKYNTQTTKEDICTERRVLFQKAKNFTVHGVFSTDRSEEEK